MANSYRIGKNKFTQDKLNTMSGTDANAIYYATHQGNKSANTASRNTGAYVDTGKRGDISSLQKEQKKDDLNDIIKNVDKIRKSMSEVPSLKKPKQEEPKQQFSNTDKYAVKSALIDNKYTANKMAVKDEIARQNVMNSDLGANQQNPKYDDRGFQTKYGRNDEIDKFLNPNYKLTREDKKRAQKIIEDYEYNHAMDANPNATELVFDEEHPDGYMKPIAEMSSEDKAEQEKIYALRDKISKGESALMGAMRTTPGVAALTRKGDEDGYWQNATANAQKQNPLAYTGGMLGNGILMNAVAQGALGATKYGEAVENLLGVGNGASAGSNVARKIAADALTDAPVDLVTDTIPELLYDIADDKSGKDIAKNLLANIALNTGMNVGASVLGNLDDIRLLQKSGESIPNTRGGDYVPDGSLQERIVGNVSSPTNNVNPNSEVVNLSNVITANSDMDIPHQIAARYAQAFSDFDTYGYMDDIQEIDGFVEKMADDIANGRDLSEYRRVLEDAIEEAPDAETAEKMQALISDIENVNKQSNGIQVYRGYNRSDNPLEKNLAREQSIYDILGKDDPNKFDLLPLEFYTESIDDATNYANHDKLFYDSLRDIVRRDVIYNQNTPKSEYEAMLKARMDEMYRTLMGREPIFNEGHVDTHTINPQKILDLTELGDTTNVDSVYELLSRELGIPQTAWEGKNVDDYFNGVFPNPEGYDFYTYMLLKNVGGSNGDYGSRFVNLMRDNGYDAVKYTEDGYNHYALLNDGFATKTEEQIVKNEDRIQSNQKTKVMAEAASPKRDKRRYYETRNMINNKRLDNGILFDNEADKKAYIEARKRFAEANDVYDKLLDTATTTDEIVQAQGNIEAAYRDMVSAASKGFENDKSNQKALREVKKNFAERVKGTVINVPDSMRNEQFFLNKTLKQINDQYTTLGNNVIKFSKNSGTPIDSIWNEIVEASGNALPADTTNPVQMIEQLNDYVMSLKVDGKGIERVPADIARYVPEKYWDRIYGLGSDTGRRIDSIAESATTTAPIADEAFDSIESAPLNERGMSRHMRGEGKMQMEGVPDEVKSDFIDDPDLYEVLSNAETKDIADDVYMSGDAPVSINGKEYTGDVETKFRTMLAEHNPSALPLGHQLAKDYSAAGNYEMAAQIYRDMGEQLTKSGQFSQAAILAMVKDDPMTALTYAERELDSLNRAGREQFGKRWKDLIFTKDELDAFNNINPGDKDAIKELFDKIGERLGREYPTTMMEKLIEGRKIAMLFNMRTMVRNVLANPPTLGMRWASDRLEALGQNIVHIIDPSFQKTQSLIGGGINGRRLANEVANSSTYENLINGTSGKYEVPDIRNSLMKNKQMFKGTAMSKFINKFTNGGIEKLNDKLFGKQGVESGLETVRNLTYKLLDLGDSPFVRENFVERLGSYINAQGIKSVDDIPPEAIETAWEAALKATYKDDSWAVQALRGIRNSIAKIPGVGKPLSQAAIPFLQAPANIGARMVEYSPVNSAVGVKDLVSGIAKKDHKAIEKGIERISKGTTGAGMVYLGMKLREAGILTGDYAQNKRQKEMQKMDGFKPWSLKVGDKYYQYNWAQPFAENLIVGTLMQDAIDNSDEYDSDILRYFGYEGSDLGKKGGALFQGSKAAVQSWVDETPIQNLLEMFGANSGGYGESDIAQSIIDNGAGDFAGALVPATVNAIAKTNDPTVRNTYDPSNAFATYLNQQQAKIPGLTDDLPAKYDLWGRESKYADSKWGAFLQKFVSPGEISKETTDPIDQELNALFKSTQKESVFPTYAPHKVDETKLTNEQESAYQRDMGQRNRAIVENFVNSDVYKSMPDDVKVEALSNVYNASKAITERDLFNKAVAENSSYKKLIAAYDEAGGGEAGAKAMADLVTQRQITSAAGLTNDSKFRASVEEDLASGNLEEANRKLSDFEILKSNGVNSATAAYMYDRQLKNNYNISPEEFGRTWVLMDTNGKEGINQDEAIGYMNRNKVSESEGLKLWNVYGDWKRVPVLENGKWKKPN